MIKKIGFISANNYKEPYLVYPIGMSYLITYLKTKFKDIDIECFDFNLGDYNDYESFISTNNFDCLCISLRNLDDVNIFEKNSFLLHYKKIISISRNLLDIPIIIGGSAFSVHPKYMFKELLPDYGIVGEGEISLYQLLDCISKENLDGIKRIEGVVYDLGGEIIINERSVFVESPKLKIDSSLANFYFEHSGMIGLQTKRGCPNSCIYCSYPNVDGKIVRTLDPKIVVENIKEIKDKENVDYLFFTDSVFNICKDYNEELAHRIIEQNVKVNWGAYFSPKNLSKKELKLYKDAGLTHIEFGSESFSDITLETYSKGVRFSDILTQSRNASDLGIFYAHFLILAGYGETEEFLNETINNSKLLGATVCFPFVGMRIYPNTKLCEIALSEGIINCEKDLLSPKYYISPDVKLEGIEGRAKASGQKWVFPNDKTCPIMDKLRKRKYKGPLWEFLRY